MSDKRSSTSTICRLATLTMKLSAPIGGLWAYTATPTSTAFTGWAAIGKSLLVGAGTGLGSMVVGIPLFLGCIVVGCFAESVLSRGRTSKGAMLGVVSGASLVALGGAIYGGIEGYKVAERWVIQANEVTTSFNNVAPRQQNAPQQAPAPALTPKAPTPAVGG